MDPPVAVQRTFTIEAHGDKRVDPWYWLNDASNPEVLQLLEQENCYAQAVLDPLSGLKESIYQEIAGRTPQTDCSPPVRHGNLWRFTRTFEGMSYPVYCAIPVPVTTHYQASMTVPATYPNAGQEDALEAYTPPAITATCLGENEMVLLDANALARGYEYMALGDFETSTTGNLLAYSVDTSGNERFTLYIEKLLLDASTKSVAPAASTVADEHSEPSTAKASMPYSMLTTFRKTVICVIDDTSYGLVFDGDAALYYVRADSQNRPYQVWRHLIDSGARSDDLIYQESDERFFVSISRTKDNEYLLIEARSKSTSEIRAIRLDQGNRAPTNWARDAILIQSRREGIEYTAEHYQGWFILLTNDSAPDFRIIATPASDLDRHNWIDLVGTSDGSTIESMEVIAGYLAIQLREEAMARIQVISLPSHIGKNGPIRTTGKTSSKQDATPMRHEGGHDASGVDRYVAGCDMTSSEATGDANSGYFLGRHPIPSTCTIGDNPDMASPFLRYGYTSLVSPLVVCDLDMATGNARVVKRQHIIGEYSEAQYCSKLVYVTSHDGRAIPMSIVYPRDMRQDGNTPCLLYGYGAYQYSINPTFSATRLSLLERGFSFAIAHVRGGGELGRRWYDEGKLAMKTNTFCDFVACARYLVDNGWTSPAMLVARGGSAGGMLMGAVANMAPELFAAIVAEVPFVDCLTTMMDPSLPLTITEWEEWGNPLEDRSAYLSMKEHSPYDNVRQGIHYPDILVTAGLTDPRVGFFEPLKWVQKLRAASPQNKVILIANMAGGHMGPSGRYAAWDEEATILSFIINAVKKGGAEK